MGNIASPNMHTQGCDQALIKDFMLQEILFLTMFEQPIIKRLGKLSHVIIEK